MKLSTLIKFACEDEAKNQAHKFPKELDEALGTYEFIENMTLDGHLKTYLPKSLKKIHLGSFRTQDALEGYINFIYDFYLIGPVIYMNCAYIHVNAFCPEDSEILGNNLSIIEDVELKQ